ncbi:MAG: sortase [Clostridiales bacterium]|nr:sortase [Clostridiales bacterium]
MKNDVSYGQKKKRNVLSDLLLILAIILLLGGVALFLVDPIKNWIRKDTVEDMEESVREMISLGEDTEITFVVDRDALQVNGEEYDYFGDEDEIIALQEQMEQAQGELPSSVVLNCIALLDIDGDANIHITVWDEATNISLRYGGGHFPESVMPGEVGNCTILAHHMRVEYSMFNTLDRAKIGDPVRIVTVDGHEYTYIIDEIKIIPPSELYENIRGDITDTKQLTLVTCTYTSSGTQRLLVIGHIIDD